MEIGQIFNFSSDNTNISVENYVYNQFVVPSTVYWAQLVFGILGVLSNVFGWIIATNLDSATSTPIILGSISIYDGLMCCVILMYATEGLKGKILK